MKNFTKFLLLFLLLYSVCSYSQGADKKQQISKAVTDYFHLERENIHVHLNKNVYLTNEQIWFKGYVFHRKAGMPFFATTNIYATLLDSEGKLIESQLLYGNLAGFSGAFKLSDSFRSGKYYLRFYTNWMNNFTEDESAVYEVTVINPEQGAATALAKPDLSKVNIVFHPEGGTLVKDAANIVGVTVSDCLNNPVPASSLDIVNSGGEILRTVQLNKLGYGKFDYPPGAPAGLKAVLKINGIAHEQTLPPAEVKGIALEINNYSFPDKMITKIKTNSFTANSLGGKPLFMVIHQDENVLIYEFAFSNGSTEQSMMILQNDLFPGTNIIRIVDSEMNQLAERIIYKNQENKLKSEIIKTGRDHQYTELKGKIDYPTMNVSISILPDATASLTNNDIYTSLLIAPYIANHSPLPGRYFFETFTKVKHYELDLFLLNQNSKYKWRDIMKNPPKPSYTFDMGLSLKATLNNKLSPNKDYKVRIVSLSGMFDEQVDINNKGEIALDNLILADSSTVRFSLLEDGVKKQELKLYPQIFNNHRNFNKVFQPRMPDCDLSVFPDTTRAGTDIFPKYNTNSIVLDEVNVEADRNALKYKKAPGNAQLRSYKITDTESHTFFYILDYIRYHGFDVENNGMDVGIYGRTMNTINGQRTTPMVYIDNVQLLSFDQLQGIQTADVDEFYVNQHAVVTSVNNKMGIIKLYMKRNLTRAVKGGVNDTAYVVKDGFTPMIPFENSQYTSTADKGFENYGVIDWQPLILPDANGEFIINVPHSSQDSIKLLIEGFSADGKLISEVKTINL